MNLPVSILVTSAGGSAAINVMHALKSQSEIPVRLVAVDIDPLAPGLYLAESKHIVPRATEERFIPRLLEICSAEQVRVVIPMLSVEIPLIAAYRKAFEDLGVFMLVSVDETNRICNDKWLTYQFFDSHGFPTPKTWLKNELPNPQSLPYPVIIKPSVGSGSRYTYRINNPEQLASFVSLAPEPVVQQFIEGTEVTVDVLADAESLLLAEVQRERIRVSDGKAVTARTVRDDKISAYLRRIVEKVKLVGPGNIQCIKGDDNLFFLEINARFAAGGLPLTVAAGVNTPLMLLELALGLSVDPVENYTTGLVMSRYLTEHFLKKNSAGDYKLVEVLNENFR